MVRFRRKKNVNAMRIGIKVGMTVLALYVGGYFLTQIGAVMNGTASPFYKGLTLIGWTVTDNVNGTVDACNYANVQAQVDNCITSTSGAGILAIVGIIAIAFLIFEFVEVSY